MRSAQDAPIPSPHFVNLFVSFPTLVSRVMAVRSWHPLTLLGLMAVWLATVGNWPLWWALLRLPEIQSPRGMLGFAGLVMIVFSAIMACLCLLMWQRTRRWLGVVLLTLSAVASHFMAAYGVVIDPTMMANVLNTDAREVRDLLSWTMLGVVLFMVVLPGVWWWRQSGQSDRSANGAGRWWQQVLASMAAVVCLSLVLWVSFQDVASLMRNYKNLRYMINPFNTVYALGKTLVGQTAHAQQLLQPLGVDAQWGDRAQAMAQQRPLVVLVVGETARVANFGFGGYARSTTPQLAALQAKGELVYFPQVLSCGTNTQTSLPCMFSHLGREQYASREERHENLLDVLQRAGASVLWMDNQSGCKGVCDRVPHVDTRSLSVPQYCPDEECFDQVMLHLLPEQLQSLERDARAAATVVVLHQMGSHGPAYYKRTPQSFKPFGPECESNALQECDRQALVNAYDNTIAYTDQVLGELVSWLHEQRRPTALVYVSDHGESLGEGGLYLHGMPYSLAPQEQKHVPMVAWFSPEFVQTSRTSLACLKQQAQAPLSHDNFFHSVLGLLDVRTEVKNPALDVFSPCMGH